MLPHAQTAYVASSPKTAAKERSAIDLGSCAWIERAIFPLSTASHLTHYGQSRKALTSGAKMLWALGMNALWDVQGIPARYKRMLLKTVVKGQHRSSPLLTTHFLFSS
ncbi:hypothetical protein FRB94_004540 [Tulasnella sp. JGI-2019a]|nr:hypothetical protein FRB94_004540 [Tulasnella sp. JGI-2019a]